MSHLIMIYTVILSVLGKRLTLLFVTMDVPKFKDVIVHFCQKLRKDDQNTSSEMPHFIEK